MIADLLPIPPGSAALISARCTVQAVLNLGTGYYDFDPTPIPVFKTSGGGAIYVLDSISFAGTPAENDFVGAISPTAIPSVQLRTTETAGVANNSYPSLALTRYLHDQRQRAFYSFPTSKPKDVNVVFFGSLIPIGGFPSTANVQFTFQATLIAMRDTNFVKAFFDGSMLQGNFPK